jgi:hypothetical protein
MHVARESKHSVHVGLLVDSDDDLATGWLPFWLLFSGVGSMPTVRRAFLI